MIVRPSGTEPKIKCYLEVVVPVDPADGVDAARIAAAGRLDAIGSDIKAAAGSRAAVTLHQVCRRTAASHGEQPVGSEITAYLMKQRS